MTRLPFVSLDAAVTTGPGASRDLEASVGKHTVIVYVTGDPSSVLAQFEGSHDGTTWFPVGTNMTGTSIQTVDAHLFRYVRVNLQTLTGGTSPTVTATIASA